MPHARRIAVTLSRLEPSATVFVPGGYFVALRIERPDAVLLQAIFARHCGGKILRLLFLLLLLCFFNRFAELFDSRNGGWAECVLAHVSP